MKKILVLLIIMLPSFVIAQDGNNTLYFLPNSPQRIKVNPSYQPEYSTYVSVPGFSGVAVNYYNNSLKVENILKWGKGEYKDSVIIDINGAHKALRKKNTTVVTTEIPALGVGFRVKDWYATIDISQKNDVALTFNKELVTFMKKGNAHYLGKYSDWGGLKFTANFYNEIALGLSKPIDEKLKVGGRFKILLGIANVDMKSSKMGAYTSPVGDTLTVYSKQNIRVSAPLKYTLDGEYVEWDDLEFDDDRVNGGFFVGKNLGFGIDLGAEYKYDEQWTFYASILDLGFINWSSHTYNFSQNTSFDWVGIDLSNSINKDNPNYVEFEDAFDDLIDSVKNRFRFTDKQKAYTTMLNAKLITGATYKYNDWVDFGGILRGSVMGKRFFPSMTLSANIRPARNFGASLTYSVVNGDFANIGAGLTANFAFFQFFLMGDNLLGINVTNTRAVNARFGFNLLFGHEKKRKMKNKYYI